MKTLFVSAACSDMAVATIELLREHCRFVLVLVARDADRLNETIARMKWESRILMIGDVAICWALWHCECCWRGDGPKIGS